MRGLWALLCCLQQVADLAGASELLRSTRHRHGTVAESRRLAFQRAAAEERREDQLATMVQLPQLPPLPDASMTPSSDLPVPLDSKTPESMANVMDYQITMPTPAPAAFNGEYCKGGACQYRVAPPPPLPPTPMPILPPPVPIGGNLMSGKELCRGLSCLGGMGMPGDPKLALYNGNCLRLYNDIAGGMVGDDNSRTVVQAYQSFMNVCKLRVGPLEVGACPAYANTILGAESMKVNNPTVGGVMEVCTDTYWFTLAFKQAELDLKLTKASLPKGSSLLANRDFLNKFGTGGNGPSSPRGIRWRDWFYKHRQWPAPPEIPRQLGADGGFGRAFVQTDSEAGNGCQTGSRQDTTPKPPIPGADSDEDTPRGLPKYLQNPPCGSPDAKAQFNVKQTHMKYQIAPGSPDGTVGPVEVDGDLFNYCANQFSEIMMGFAQTASVTVQMTKDWCLWQASVSSWVGKQDEFGHPDWTHRTCSNMEVFMAFVLKDNLKDKKGGLSAEQICKKTYLTIGAVHRTESIVNDAWVLQSTRAAPSGGGIPSGDDSGMKDLMEQAQQAANKIFNMMRKQKSAYDDLNGAKMATAAFDANTIEAPSPPAAPDLPDSSDLDPTALIALSVERVRHSSRVGVTLADALKPWGK